MGASSSGLLDEAKISHVKGLVDSTVESFSVFYRQQYSSAYFGHLHQEVEPKKEGKGLLLTHRPPYPPEEVLYQGNVKVSCWDEQGKKCKERYTVLRRNYNVEIHENMETFNRGAVAKWVLSPVGGSVLSTEEESRAHLEQTCTTILNGVKEDSSSVVSSPDKFAVYLHLPYTGHTCFLFQQEDERDHFLSALRTCIRHQNLDPWCNSSYESQAYIQAFQLYRQNKGSYESWEMLLGTEEQVLASQVMEEVLPWLESQLQSRLKGKKTERIRQWLATVQATYTLVLEQLTASLDALRKECRQTASANQALIRSNLDQIIASHCFLEQKVRACICEEAEKVCSETVAPYLSSILEVLTENISAGFQGMQHTLHTQMDSAFTATNEGTEETKKALSALGSISLDQSYRKVMNLTENLKDLKERFGLGSAQRLVHSAHLEMEQLLDSAVYTLELFLQSSARLQPSQVPVKMDRAKERVLKQLDHDSRLVQRRLYQEALLEVTQPALTKKMDSKWKTELQQFDQYIFSDYSSFLLVHNVYDDILRNILSKEIETVVQDAASKKTNDLLLDTSDLTISQYSLLGQTPPRSAPDSPAIQARDPSSVPPSEDKESAPESENESQAVATDIYPQTDQELNSEAKSDPSTSTDQTAVLLSPVIVVTQQLDETSCFNETSKEAEFRTETSVTDSASSDTDSAVTNEVKTPDPITTPEATNPIPDSPNTSMSTLSSPQSTNVSDECTTSAITETSDQISEDASSIQPSCSSPTLPPCTESPLRICLLSLSEIDCDFLPPSVEQTTDRAVYLTGEIKDNWEKERVIKEKEGAEERNEGSEADEEKGGGLEKIKEEDEAEVNGDQGQREEKEEEEEKVTHWEVEKVIKEKEGAEERSEGSEADEEKGGGLEKRKEEDEAEVNGDQGQREEKEEEEEEVTHWEVERVIKEKEGAEERSEGSEADEEKGGGLERRKEEDEEEVNGDQDQKEENKEEEEKVPQSPQPLEAEHSAEQPLDSVALIRDLVTEIIEVETVISPLSDSSDTP